MSQSQLVVALRANSAALLPVLLVASSVNEARPSPVINIRYEDTALLQEGDKAIVQFTGASGTPVYGTENAIKELRATYPFLKGKDEKQVQHKYLTNTPCQVVCLTPAVGGLLAVPAGFFRSP